MEPRKKPSFNTQRVERILQNCIWRARLHKEARTVIIRDGSYSEAWAKTLKKRARGQHDEFMEKSIEISKMNAIIMEECLKHDETTLERELQTLPAPLKQRIQTALQKLQSLTSKPLQPKKNVKARKRRRANIYDGAPTT